MIEKIEIENIVIGAGVIGLSVAAEMSRRGHVVYVLEAQAKIGSGISSRNSEVIHSGIYYPKDSLRAKFCVEGRKKLYDYCYRNDVPHKQCGKLIVATNQDEVTKLDKIYVSGINNGIDKIYFLNSKETAHRAPQINAVASLFIPDTGIIDSHSYMSCLEKEIESAGGKVLLNHSVVRGSVKPNNFTLLIQTKSEIFQLHAKNLIVACGLFTHQLCSNLEGYKLDRIPNLHLAKGNYFSYGGSDKFDNLIYPVPVPGGLGTHLTFDMMGAIRFGPDVEWLDDNDPNHINYMVDSTRVASFHSAIRRYWPSIMPDALAPAYSGVRPKLYAHNEVVADFLIDAPENHDVSGMFILFGIESPGLTSSPAIGRYISEKINQK